MTSKTSPASANNGPISVVLSWIDRIGQIGAWLIIPIIVVVIFSVIASALKWGIITEWGDDVLLFGSRLTLASLGDLQWHLFGLMLMLTVPGTLVKDRHVRVDFIRAKMSDRSKQIIDITGHLFFLLPFCTVIFWKGAQFAMRAFSTGEGSNYDGLYDRFLIKSTIPLGFGLLAVAAILLIAFEVKRGLSSKTKEDNS